ncbi:ArsR family transcriptional regulator [Mycobacteroides abscessus subsp. bolletii]|uniref:ArsR/SmtB family transcription factor n=1 Tax=Mycobacteroides abscessus TaxID=36809 RepID=UPI0009A81ECD|nr:helix-turn-helix domain-containing protein [Mycobacteroides abscessus]SKG70936.1 ArsR family transcriptional regulator [Mycobacteroides abscessus subsp. bolletii]SKH11667.1 ArsR family transcriptional regulator [Mycobacteroides abscessus subsp. bolletii]
MTRRRNPARTVDHPDPAEVSLQQVLDAFVDPVRRLVVSQLVQAGEDISCGTFDVPVAISTLTHHFNVLREAGIIRQYYVGTTKMNSLRRDELEGRFPGLLTSLVAACATEIQADAAHRQAYSPA